MGSEPITLFLERKRLQKSDLEASTTRIIQKWKLVDAPDGPNRASEERPRAIPFGARKPAASVRVVPVSTSTLKEGSSFSCLSARKPERRA
jgi:hypothetical protein